MAGRYVGFGKKLFDLARSGGKSNVSTTIVGVNPAKNLTTKRNIQDKVVSAVDQGIKKADVPQSMKESQSTKQYASEMKRKKAKELKDYSYKLDKLTEKKAKGGRVGLKSGSFPDYSGDGKTTMKDILMGRGVIPKPKNKKNMKKVAKTPIAKAVRKA